jgi:hypothetical protein
MINSEFLAGSPGSDFLAQLAFEHFRFELRFVFRHVKLPQLGLSSSSLERANFTVFSIF